MLAVASNHLLVIDFLLLRGADPNLVEKTLGRSVLHSAAFAGNYEVAVRLAEGGADIDATDNAGSSPLSLSAQQGHLKTLKYLVEKGANINCAMKGDTALYYAALRGHLEVIQFLVLNRADMTVGRSGWSPLEAAFAEGHSEIVDLLLKAGARYEEIGTAMRQCKACGKIDDRNMKCRGCEVVHYCSAECQKKDWKTHKVQCKSIKAKVAAYKEKKIRAVEE